MKWLIKLGIIHVYKFKKERIAATKEKHIGKAEFFNKFKEIPLFFFTADIDIDIETRYDKAVPNGAAIAPKSSVPINKKLTMLLVTAPHINEKVAVLTLPVLSSKVFTGVKYE